VTYGETISSDYDGTNTTSSRSLIWNSSELDGSDYLMDHCIEIDSNRRMRDQFINPLKLTFKDSEMERDVRKTVSRAGKDFLPLSLYTI